MLLRLGNCRRGLSRESPQTNVYRTNVLSNRRTSLFEPCTNSLHLKEKFDVSANRHAPPNSNEMKNLFEERDGLGEGVFQRTPDDEKPAMSVEDKAFLEIMHKEVFIDDSNSWVAPLPFKELRRKLPNNRAQALKRFLTLRHTLAKKPDMREHRVAFMQKSFKAGHAEPAPLLSEKQECWYLLTFGVDHPHKPGQVRAVFDSNAKHEGISLNDVL